jgi:hypothetical protein
VVTTFSVRGLLGICDSLRPSSTKPFEIERQVG